MIRPHAPLVAAALLAACGQGQSAPVEEAPAPSDSADLIADGREIVEAQCVLCHATGVEGESPRTDAPPLRTVLARFDAEALADDFREGIHVGHEDMPDFEFGPRGVEAVLAYLVSIQERPAEQ
ncbi:MAG: cytochrome c [Pseudomonadota bacterium]